MLPTGETISPRSKFPDQTASINIHVQRCLALPYWSAYPERLLITSLFFEIAQVVPAASPEVYRLTKH
jgi:hypothetical protein